MKINPTAAYQAYNKISDYGHTLRRTGAAGETPAAEKSEQLSRSILAEIREPASAERLESLRNAVQKGEYNVPTDRLVDAVMRHLVA